MNDPQDLALRDIKSFLIEEALVPDDRTAFAYAVDCRSGRTSLAELLSRGGVAAIKPPSTPAEHHLGTPVSKLAAPSTPSAAETPAPAAADGTPGATDDDHEPDPVLEQQGRPAAGGPPARAGAPAAAASPTPPKPQSSPSAPARAGAAAAPASTTTATPPSRAAAPSATPPSRAGASTPPNRAASSTPPARSTTPAAHSKPAAAPSEDDPFGVNAVKDATNAGSLQPSSRVFPEYYPESLKKFIQSCGINKLKKFEEVLRQNNYIDASGDAFSLPEDCKIIVFAKKHGDAANDYFNDQIAA